MANVVQAVFQCASGRYVSFSDTSVTDNTTTTIKTGGVGLNQTSGLDFGDALVGEVVVAGFVATNAATSGSVAATFSFAYIENPDGSVAVPVQGGGCYANQLPQLCRPIRVTVGMILKCQTTTSDATEVKANVAIYCASGKSAIMQVSAVADTETEIVDLITGGSIGQSLAGQRIVKMYSTFGNLYGSNDDGGGNCFFFIESPQGQLKGATFPVNAREGWYADYGMYSIPIGQNDTLKVTWGS